MSKVISCILIVCIVLSLVAVLTGSGQDFSLKDYVNGLSSPPVMPAVPEAPEWSGNFFGDLGSGLQFIGKCLWYPFQFIGYIANVVTFFFKGLRV